MVHVENESALLHSIKQSVASLINRWRLRLESQLALIEVEEGSADARQLALAGWKAMETDDLDKALELAQRSIESGGNTELGIELASFVSYLKQDWENCLEFGRLHPQPAKARPDFVACFAYSSAQADCTSEGLELLNLHSIDSHPKLRNAYAFCLQHDNGAAEAIVFLKKHSDDLDCDGLLIYADCQFAGSHFDEALESYKKARLLNSDNRDAESGIRKCRQAIAARQGHGSLRFDP